jgi:bifunctional DNA-binding transcriptional regulator/antitoxin component of YhaV-PrlF toxin-antitoxin module
MKTTYKTIVIGTGNHAALEIPLAHLDPIGGNKRAPLKLTINGHTYQSTATGVNGKCMVVFPMRDREQAHVAAGDVVQVTLELDNGYREVIMPEELNKRLEEQNLSKKFANLNYSTRKECARDVTEAKSDETRQRRIEKINTNLK